MMKNSKALLCVFFTFLYIGITYGKIDITILKFEGANIQLIGTKTLLKIHEGLKTDVNKIITKEETKIFIGINKNILGIDENTTITFDKEGENIVINLEEGRIRLNSLNSSQRFIIYTPHIKINADHCDIMIENFHITKREAVYILEGSVLFTNRRLHYTKTLIQNDIFEIVQETNGLIESQEQMSSAIRNFFQNILKIELPKKEEKLVNIKVKEPKVPPVPPEEEGFVFSGKYIWGYIFLWTFCIIGLIVIIYVVTKVKG